MTTRNMCNISSCNLKNSLKNSSASCDIVKDLVIEKKWSNLVSLSTTKNMKSLPRTFSKPMMKSMEMLSHFCFGIGNGCKRPAIWLCSTFFCFHVGKSTYLITSLFNPFQYNLSLNILYVLKKPGWPANGESWALFKKTSSRSNQGPQRLCICTRWLNPTPYTYHHGYSCQKFHNKLMLGILYI